MKAWVISTALAVFLVAGLPGNTAGGENEGEVRRLNEKGKVLFRAGRTVDAVKVWKEAFLSACGEQELSLANNLGIAHYKLSEFPEAYYFFAHSLAIDAHGFYKLKNRAKVEAAATQLESELAGSGGRVELKVGPVPNASVCIGEAITDDCYKTPFAWYFSPGKHKLVISRPGMMTTSREVEVDKGNVLLLSESLDSLPAAIENTGVGSPLSEVAAGANHTCALDEGGKLVCWGDNRYGQLGDGSCDWYRPSRAPVANSHGNALEVVSGGGHSCALLENGQVICWGRNSSGQLGDGAGGMDSDRRPHPEHVVGLPGLARHLAAGREHSCALIADGSVACWGSNARGQLGSGTEARRLGMSTVPMPVEGLNRPAIALTAGAAHTCALLDDGCAACWGANDAGQLGDGGADDRARAERVAGKTGVLQALAAGDKHTCGVTKAGRIACWGDGSRGQLGDPSSGHRKLPALINGGPGKTQRIAAGANHTCVGAEDNKVWCWGDSGLAVSDSYMPAVVEELLFPARKLTAGGGHTCTLLAGGSVACWGSNRSGQLGDGTTAEGGVAVTGH